MWLPPKDELQSLIRRVQPLPALLRIHPKNNCMLHGVMEKCATECEVEPLRAHRAVWVGRDL